MKLAAVLTELRVFWCFAGVYVAVFVKKFGDKVLTWNNNSTPGIVKSRACASLF